MVKGFEKLKDILRHLPPLAIACSGGLDSRFLCHAALLCGCDVIAIHVRGPHVPQNESGLARAWAAKNNLNMTELIVNPLEIPEIASNSKRRCYFCKKFMLSRITAWLDANAPERQLCDGGNLDDLQKYRPGLQAVREAQVRSPLSEAGLAKSDIRALAEATDLENPHQLAHPCLLTRFAYDYPISEAQLRHIEQLEKIVARHLASLPLPPDFRLRFCPRPLLQISAINPDLEKSLQTLLLENGLKDCQILLSENLSGFFDENPGGKIP